MGTHVSSSVVSPLYHRVHTGSSFLMGMSGRGSGLTPVTSMPACVIDETVCISFRSKGLVVECSCVFEKSDFYILPFGGVSTSNPISVSVSHIREVGALVNDL